MYKLALIGRNISHSLSQKMYEELLGTSVVYSLLDYKSEAVIPELDEVFSTGLQGVSITSPYKSYFIDQVEIESDDIKNLGVINCIKKVNGCYSATNTDLLACREILIRLIKEKRVDHVTLLGNGHMAQTLVLLLKEVRIGFEKIARSEYGAIEEVIIQTRANKELVINCCSRDFNFKGVLDKNSFFWDLNYSHNHNKSFLSNKCTYVDGLELLKLQAQYALRFWNIGTK